MPKGLKFLCVVPLSESPKVMGLVGIHDPDAWCVIDVMIAHPQHLTPSTTMASMTAINLGKMFPPSWFHPTRLQENTTTSAENPNKEEETEWST